MNMVIIAQKVMLPVFAITTWICSHPSTSRSLPRAFFAEGEITVFGPEMRIEEDELFPIPPPLECSEMPR